MVADLGSASLRWLNRSDGSGGEMVGSSRSGGWQLSDGVEVKNDGG